MKRTISIITVLTLLFSLLFTINVNATSLDAINVETDKTVVNPGTNVNVNIEFGKSLGAYTFDIAYDNSLFEFVSTSDGTPNDNGTRVRVVYYDSTGGSNTKDNLKVTFKAKEGITTSNPTDFSITAEGLANGDASEQYDDITIPIVKNITVEPDYKDYELNLEYDGNIIENEEKEITISTVSEMGRYYDHARLIAEVTTSSGGTVTLKGIDESQTEHDLIQSGWGDPSGYKIGGKVNQVLKFQGIFTKIGDYEITLKLIDRDSSDAVIAQKTFNISVVDENYVEDNTDNEEENEKPEENGQIENNIVNNEVEELPEELPKTGINYMQIGIVIIITLILSYIIINKKK